MTARRMAPLLIGLMLIATACNGGEETASSDQEEAVATPDVADPTGEAAEPAADDATDVMASDVAATPSDEAATADAPAEQASLSLGVVGAAMQPTFAPYTSVPTDLGFFADENLDVEFVNVGGSAEAVEAVAAGQLDIALILSPPVLKAIESGADVGVFYNHITRNFAIPHVPEDSEIQQPADFAGSTIGVVSPGAGAIPQITALVEREGGDASGIEFVPVGAGPDVAELARGGQIDVVGLWDSVFASIEGAGVPLRPVTTDWFDELGFQGVFVAQQTTMTERSDVLARFGRAVARGTVFAEANPDAAITAHFTVFPDSAAVGVSEEEARRIALNSLESRLPSLVQPDGGWGAAGEDTIQGLQDVLVEGGYLTEPLPLGDVFDNSMVEAFNDFDAGAVEELAAQ